MALQGNEMFKDSLYKQCLLTQGNLQWIAWVPIHLAKLNKIVNPKGRGSAIIKEVFDSAIVDHEEILAMADYWKHQREASDI